MISNNKAIALIATTLSESAETEVAAVEAYFRGHFDRPIILAENLLLPGSTEQRVENFIKLLFDDKVAILWSLRGGEGTADMLPLLDGFYDDIAKLAPKILIGFSDFTPVLLYFAQKFHWPVWHGPAALQLSKGLLCELSEQLVRRFVWGQSIECLLRLEPANEMALRQEKIRGSLLGGNLSLLSISIKDLYEIDADDKIVVIEEVGEKPHAVSRNLKYLQRIGKFDRVRAIVLGDLNGQSLFAIEQKLAPPNENFSKVIRHFVSLVSCPVYITRDFGHGKTNCLLPFCREVVISQSQLLLDGNG